MSNSIAVSDATVAIEQALVGGDLSKLSTEQRIEFYRRTCESLGLNALTRPFDYITLNGKLTLYAKRDATDQLRKVHRVSVSIVSRETVGDVYVVTARATTPDGRTDESTGAVAIGGKRGDDLCNALMKAETKSKRRVTLSIAGLGILDESELETVTTAKPDNRQPLRAAIKELQEQSQRPPKTTKTEDDLTSQEREAIYAAEEQLRKCETLKELTATAAKLKSEVAADLLQFLNPVFMKRKKELANAK